MFAFTSKMKEVTFMIKVVKVLQSQSLQNTQKQFIGLIEHEF